MIAEAEQIKFQRLAFHHFHTWNVTDVDGRKIRLTSNRTQASELRTIELNEVIPIWMLIIERRSEEHRVGKECPV